MPKLPRRAVKPKAESHDKYDPGVTPRTELGLAARACSLFCKGNSPQAIADELGVGRQVPYRLLLLGASKGWLKFYAPLRDRLREEVAWAFPWLRQVEVVDSEDHADVAFHAAVMIRDLIAKRCHNGKLDEVRLGFAGGYSMRTVAEKLAFVLSQRQPSEDIPKRFTFGSLNVSFDASTLLADPNAFLTYFAASAIRDQGIEVGFQCLRAEPFMKTESFGALKSGGGSTQDGHDALRASIAFASKLDILVTSASSADDDHNLIKQYLSLPLKELKKGEYSGDLLWMPLSPTGPIRIDQPPYKVRPVGVVDLWELPEFISSGKQVVLVIGPCGRCGRPKGDILRTILCQPKPLITHLIADRRSVDQMFRIGVSRP